MHDKSPLTALKGVGERKMNRFKNINILTVQDLITHYPRAYSDRSREVMLGEGEESAPSTYRLWIVTKQRFFKNGKTGLKMSARDGVGQVCTIYYFNAPYMENKFSIGEVYLFFGQLQGLGKQWVLTQPECVESDKADQFKRIEPIYNLTMGVTSREIASLVEQSLSHLRIKESLPTHLLEQHHLLSREEALKSIHFPESFERGHQARTRLVFEELFTFQLGLLLLKGKYTQRQGIVFKRQQDAMNQLIASLPFDLTEGQKQAWNDIETDMASTNRMNRLLQGDVGSGKTILAAMAIYMATLNGYQAILMAPTEILARQHFESLTHVFEKMTPAPAIALLTASSKQKALLKESIEAGRIQLVIGTHALLTDDVRFKRLGLVITDEQHRFGVRQRSKISDKGDQPDVLVMSATPIPRTLSLILYGDMDISQMRDMPRNRKVIGTHYVKPEKEMDLYGFLETAFEEGRQAYAVCPLIEDSEQLELTSVLTYHEKLSKRFSKFKVALLHGKLKPSEKQQIMASFAAGETQLLVSTTVIEVGVNVPNATIMVIQNAERFGLSQLHQLRGRVGRGSEKSWCFLLSEKPGKIAKQRIETLVKSQSGFDIAEKDLSLRGPGELLGNRQHGVPDFKLANLVTDLEILLLAQESAKKIIIEEHDFGSYEDELVRASTEIFEGFSI